MIYISIGSNLGNRLENLKEATKLLKRNIFSSLQVLPILETEALLQTDAPAEWNRPFLNTIAYGNSSLSPEKLLKSLKAIEIKLGRPAVYKKWEPRIIDLDILVWDDLTMKTPSLTIPHAELYNRPFLLHLLALIKPEFGETANSFPNITDKALALYPQFVGVLNLTPDSFSDGGNYFAYECAIARALELFDSGAAIVELGAQSTRPGAVIVDSEEEYSRLEPVLDGLLKEMRAGTIRISVDTFYPEMVRKLIEKYPISWINDVKGDLDENTLKEIADCGCKIVAMHSLSIPALKGEHISSNDIVDKWFEKTIERLLKCGFQKNSIIIDPGIGFGKSSYQSLALIRDAKQTKRFGCPVLFGHSRKSYISAFCNLPPAERDLETIAVSDYLNDCGIDFLRVHNVKDHQRFFVAKQLVQGGVHV